MPKHSFSENPAPLSDNESQLRERLRKHVTTLASDIGERNIPRHSSLQAASDYIRRELESYGYAVAKQTFTVSGREVANLSVEIRGLKRSDEVIVVGAHYDSVVGTPGANDNASGVAALLELARALKGKQFDRTIEFVFFTNEEPPYFQTSDMGSVVYARSLRARNANVVGMISIETIGAYYNTRNSQHYPPGIAALYPDKANFIGFVSNADSSKLLKRAIGAFRESAQIASEGLVAPDNLEGVGWSDHWSFWQQGYPAIMVTDTAPFRYPHYHQRTDTVDKIDFDNMTRVVSGLLRVVEDLASSDK
jgi:Zn-dependent M28 family amino/carboxypeptidase